MTDAIDPKSLEAAARAFCGDACQVACASCTHLTQAAIAAYLAAEREDGRVMVPVAQRCPNCRVVFCKVHDVDAMIAAAKGEG